MTTITRLLMMITLITGTLTAHVSLTHEDEQQIKDAGQWEEYQQSLSDSEQHRMSSDLITKARDRVQRARLETIGYTEDEIEQALSPSLDTLESAAVPGGSSYSQMPSIGNDVKTMVIVVEFADYRLADPDDDGDTSDAITLSSISDNIFGSGTTTANTSYPGNDSVSDYFLRASNNLLTITGDVYLHTMPNNRSAYEPADTSSSNSQFFYDTIIKPALDALDASVDFSQYDNDSDGDLDSCNIIFCGPNGTWASYWWGFSFGANVGDVTYDGISIEDFTRQRLALRSTNDFNPSTLIHELGHKLGLPDIYDYDGDTGNNGGVGGIGLMGGDGDINPFFKWILDWQDPVIINSGAPQTVTLNARSDTSLSGNKAYAVWPNIENTDDDDLLTEFFIIENSQDVGNDSNAYNGEGLLIWHIDAEWGGSASYGYVNDNSYTTDKLIKVVQADGLGEIETGSYHDAGDFWSTGQSFTPTSTPSSSANDGSTSAVIVENISTNGSVMTADIGFNVTGVPENLTLYASSSADVDTPVLMTAFASDPDGDALSYEFTFGDGNSSTNNINRHTYSTGGTFTVGVNVSDGNSFPLYTEQEITISDPLSTLSTMTTLSDTATKLEACGDYLFAAMWGTVAIYNSNTDSWSEYGQSELGGFFDIEDVTTDGTTFALSGRRYNFSTGTWFSCILSTDDFSTWQYADLSSSSNLNGIAYSGSNWIVVGDAGYIATSTDLSSWTERSSGNTIKCHDIAFGNDVLVVTQAYYDSTTQTTYSEILFSNDYGITWSTATSLPNSYSIYPIKVIWDGSRFMLINYWDDIFYSTDGANWSETNHNPNNDISQRNISISYGAGRYLLALTSSTYSTNEDYLNWSELHTGTYSFADSAFLNDRFYLLDDSGTIYQTGLITNKQSTWLSTNSVSAFTDDTDSDGVSALLEYALDDNESGTTLTGDILEMSHSDEGMTITFTKPDDRDDVIYTIESSTTLATDSWTDTGMTITNETSSILEVMSGTSTDEGEFYRLSVELAE